ncbi:hypothetical protein [Nostoc sp. DedQUE07]|uniref:hypothetical protein n=1 Tax=Nostoc sp. DedQUE07 TaxID=3075392 RepID=UPI002AD2CF49|nr:hypothetical protein [Nostoc sp. DedQUE07]MDZ8130797.1 hypothetical protein [Nostoc sp. DedQUE07]
MESTLFTALSTNEEANLSGGFFSAPKINVNVVKTNQYANAKAYGFNATAYASNSNTVYIDN